MSSDTAPLDVAVVGAGLSGLACAHTLRGAGHHVSVFEKARGPGGRMSTRRADELRFDHGAQYFTVRDPRFAAFLAPLREEGSVVRWDGRFAVVNGGAWREAGQDTERFVGVPGMNAVCRHLVQHVDVAYSTRVVGLMRVEGRWTVQFEDGSTRGGFDAAVVSAPAPQAAALLHAASPALAARARAVRMSPCWAVLAAFPRRMGLPFDAAFVEDGPLAWVARNASKPGRPAGEAWVLHATPSWSRDHLDTEGPEAARPLLGAFWITVGAPPVEPAFVAAHRWLYAQPEEPLSDPCLFDGSMGIAACGDWCGGPRVEGAWLSGRAAADRLLTWQPGVSP